VVHDVAYGPLWTTLCCTEGGRGRRLITTTFCYQLCAIPLEIISTWKYMCQFYTEDNTSITAMCSKVESELYRLRIQERRKQMILIDWLRKQLYMYCCIYTDVCWNETHTCTRARAHTHTHTHFFNALPKFCYKASPIFLLLHNFHSRWFYIYFKMFASKVYNIGFAVLLVYTSI
jgi:hypothetical protein